MTFVQRFLPQTQLSLVPISIATAIAIVVLLRRHASFKATRLRGPRRKNILLGYSRELMRLNEATRLCDEWEEEYGAAYEVPSLFGTQEIVLSDPTAIMHHLSHDTYTYGQTLLIRRILKAFFGKNLLYAEGDDHKRQRKALSPAFGNSQISKLTPVFFDCAYTLKSVWDAMLQDSDNLTTDVAQWLDYLSLDAIGIAGFAHDFGSLKGKKPEMAAVLDSFGDVQMTFLGMVTLVLSAVIPALAKAPTQRNIVMRNLQNCAQQIAVNFLQSARKEKTLNESEQTLDKSIMGLLLKSEEASTMTQEEILGQHIMIVGGYETTSIAMTWALVELARNPAVQERLREELAQFSAHDPTWEQLVHSLPYLDAFTCETLRVHPPVSQTFKQAYEDDTVPLAQPTVDSKGNNIDCIRIAKGTIVRVPIGTMNRSTSFWGDDAKVFNPDRWLDNGLSGMRASEIRGYRHLLTFSEGPRTCIGRAFAVTEFKAVMSVLVRNYSFELPDGPGTKFESHMTFFDRPKTAGQHGPKVPLIIRKTQL